MKFEVLSGGILVVKCGCGQEQRISINDAFKEMVRINLAEVYGFPPEEWHEGKQIGSGWK